MRVGKIMNNKNKFSNKFSNLESMEDTQRYIKEMHEMSDRNARITNITFAAVGIPLLIIFTLTILQMFSFTINLAKGSIDDSKPEIVSNSGNTSTDTSSKDSNAATSDTSNTQGTVQVTSEKLNSKIYTYLTDSKNRTTSLNKATALNKGNSKGLATTFVAQVLRDNGYTISDKIINTDALVKQLENDGWEKITDYNKLEPGDVCFTVKSTSGAPSHTYIFMGWVQAGKTDNGYIVDSQISEYKDTYHQRNISVSTPKKDKFDFFMRKK